MVRRAKAIASAIDYAKFRSRSCRAVIRVYDEAGNVIETHKHTGEFKSKNNGNRETVRIRFIA